MSRLLAGVGASGHAGTDRATTPGPSLTRCLERAPDLAVVLLATWTPVYHLCLVLRLGAPWALAIEMVVLAGAVLLARHRRAPGRGDAPDRWDAAERWDPPERSSAPARPLRGSWGPARAALVITLVAASAGAVVLAADGSWPLVAALWLTASLTGTLWAAAALRRDGAPTAAAPGAPAQAPAPAPAGARGSGAVLAVVWALGLAALSMATRRPDPDDLFYVNLSQWTVDHGTYPLRDTLFADLVHPMTSWPPLASYDALVGTVAWLVGVPAASVVYLVVPPVATALSVLALWRLLRAWRVRAVGLALSVALVFLLLDGGPGYAAPGNLFLTRLWQGKVVLLCLLVPTLLVHALRYAERPDRRRAAWLLAGGGAAVGLSTTAIFLVPIIAVAGAAPLLLRGRPVRAALGCAAMAAYPLAAGVATLVLGGRSADDFENRRLYRFDPQWFGHEIFRDGPVALVGVAAVLLGAVVVARRDAAVTTGLLVSVTGITFVPGVTELTYDLVGLGPTLWRVSWVATVAALVGAAAATGLDRGWPLVPRWGVPVAVTAALVVSGLPVWSAANGVSLDAAPRWKRSTASVAVAQRAIGAAAPGDVVLASRDVSVTIAVLTTQVKTVAPRAYFLDQLSEEPGLHVEARRTLVAYARGEPVPGGAPAVAAALDVVGVDEVCLSQRLWGRVGVARARGYRPVFAAEGTVCLIR